MDDFVLGMILDESNYHELMAANFIIIEGNPYNSVQTIAEYSGYEIEQALLIQDIIETMDDYEYGIEILKKKIKNFKK